MIARILIVLILLLSVLNIIGQPVRDKAASHIEKHNFVNQDAPASLVPVIDSYPALPFCCSAKAISTAS
jgi:hypothetical protein